jgi:hypothetical protein
MMNLNRDKQIADAMATAGFDGNRYGSFAAGKAAEIGAQTSLAQDHLLLSTLSDFANQQENRALGATGMGIQTAGMMDQMAQDRLKLPWQIAMGEQGRADQIAQMQYGDRLGWFPHLLQAAMSQGTGTPGQIYSTTTPGQPGAADWLQLLGGFF